MLGQHVINLGFSKRSEHKIENSNPASDRYFI